MIVGCRYNDDGDYTVRFCEECQFTGSDRMCAIYREVYDYFLFNESGGNVGSLI